MKAITVIISAVCFLLISTLRAEEEQLKIDEFSDINANIFGLDVLPDPSQSSNDKISGSFVKTPEETTLEEQRQQYLAQEAKRKKREKKNKEENEEENEDENSESEENDEESDYGDEEEEDDEGYWQRKQDQELEHLSHQADLFSNLNLNHRFNDLSVSLDEGMEDMVRVLGQDDNLPLRELDAHHFQKRTSRNATKQQTNLEMFNDYSVIEQLSDDYSDISDPFLED